MEGTQLWKVMTHVKRYKASINPTNKTEEDEWSNLRVLEQKNLTLSPTEVGIKETAAGKPHGQGASARALESFKPSERSVARC